MLPPAVLTAAQFEDDHAQHPVKTAA